MNQFFSLERPIQMQLTILETLYFSEKSYSLEKLAHSISSDKRSAAQYCQKIQELPNTIHFSKTSSYYRFSGDAKEYQLLRSDILALSPIFQLVYQLILLSKIQINEFLDSLEISEFILRRHMTQLNKKLDPYQIQIKTKKGDIYLTGKETQIRYFSYLVLWETYQGVTWPFSTIDFEQTLSDVEGLFEAVGQQPNKIKALQWCYISAINLLRSSQGHLIDNKTLPSFTTQIWKEFSEEVESFQQAIGDKLSETELRFSFLWMQSKTNFYLAENFLERALKLHLAKQTSARLFLIKFFSYLNTLKRNQLNHIKKRKLLNATLLANSMHAILFPNFLTLNKEFIFDIEEKHPKLLEEMTRVCTEFKDQDQALYWLQPWILTEAFLIIAPPTYFDKQVNIKFESDLPHSLELATMKKINDSLRPYINVFMTNDLVIQPDLIIRTTDTLLTMPKFEEEPTAVTISIQYIEKQIHSLVHFIKERFTP